MVLQCISSDCCWRTVRLALTPFFFVFFVFNLWSARYSLHMFRSTFLAQAVAFFFGATVCDEAFLQCRSSALCSSQLLILLFQEFSKKNIFLRKERTIYFCARPLPLKKNSAAISISSERHQDWQGFFVVVKHQKLFSGI